MSWESLANPGSAAAKLPIVTLEAGKPIRLRFIGRNSAPAIADNPKYADGGKSYWGHWTPDEFNEAMGWDKGGRMVPCIGPRNGCIFHAGELRWRANAKGHCNALVYTNYSAAKKTFDEKVIMDFSGGTKIWTQIVEQCRNTGIAPDEVDWIIGRTGKSMNDTTYTATMVKEVFDPTIDLFAMEAQAEYADDDVPPLIDFDKYPGQEIKTPEQQEEWYNQIIASAEAAPAAASDTTTPANTEAKAPPSAPAPAAPRPATATGEPIQMPKRLGRLSNEEKAAKEAFEAANPGQVWVRPPKTDTPTPAATTTPAAPPKPTPAIKPVPASPKPGPSPYDLASKVVDPWGKPMVESDNLEFLANASGTELSEYQITPEIQSAAKIVLAGPTTKPAAPPAPVAAEPNNEALGDAAEDDANIENLQRQLLTLTKSSETLRSFVGMKKFLKNCCGGASAIGQITDPDDLRALIELCQAGEEEIVKAINA